MSTAPRTPSIGRVKWGVVGWMVFIHAGVLLAPITFTWSGLAVCLVLYVVSALGITMGYHRLLTHRSFHTPGFLEHVLSLCGCLAAEGGPLQWVATHRAHHQFSDKPGDPHSPCDGFWWAHMLWMFRVHPVLDTPEGQRRFVKDLARDPFHRFLERFQLPLHLLVAMLLYGVGALAFGAGPSWLVWGFFVRIVFTYHATWAVNSAAHTWGYQNYPTGDRSTNLWWVALVSLGEGWHNNHHAFPRSAPHGLRWWEFDFTYRVIRMAKWLGLATDIQLPKPGYRVPPATPRPPATPEPSKEPAVT